MGCCKDREIYRIVRYLLEHFTGTLVLDADALNSLAEFGVNALENRRCTVILTPHVKEFSRLCQTTVQEVCENGTALARAFAKRYGVTLMLKSNATLISDQSRAAVSSAGSPALAKGGSGDVLAGLTAAIAARTDDTVWRAPARRLFWAKARFLFPRCWANTACALPTSCRRSPRPSKN